MITPRRAIPPAVGALPGVPLVSILEIGQPDIHDAVEQADHLGLLVPPAVVDKRQLKAPLAGRKN
jgi:hypothetical protein